MILRSSFIVAALQKMIPGRLIFTVIGVSFGIVMYTSEAASWFRVYEMFQFDAFYMYGIIGSALIPGITGLQLIKKLNLKSFSEEPIKIAP